MKEKLLIFFMFLVLAFLFAGCSTLPKHPIQADAADAPLWVYSQEEIIEQIAKADGFFAITTSVYPFMVTYNSVAAETVGDKQLPHRSEIISYYFTEDGELYSMEQTFSLGIAAVLSSDKFNYAPGIIKQYETLEKKYLKQFGASDETIAVDEMVDGVRHHRDGQIWYSVPFGNPPHNSNLILKIESFKSDPTNTLPFYLFSVKYTRNDVNIMEPGLHEALVRDNPERVLTLLKNGADPDATIQCRIAMDYGNYRYVRMDFDSLQPLYYAVRMNNIDDRERIVQALLDAGADVNKVSNFFVPTLDKTLTDTPLAAAVGQNRPNIVRLLIDAGADTKMPSENYGGSTPIEIAETNGFDEILEMLKNN